jgi:hypothetical protein
MGDNETISHREKEAAQMRISAPRHPKYLTTLCAGVAGALLVHPALQPRPAVAREIINAEPEDKSAANGEAADAEAANAEALLQPRAGEILLEGTLEEVSEKAAQLSAASFTLPSGKTAKIASPKNKELLMLKSSLLFARGTIAPLLPFSRLKAGWRGAAVGRDEGAGKPLRVRALAVWTRKRNGKYLIEGTRTLQPEPTSPEAAPGNAPVAAPVPLVVTAPAPIAPAAVAPATPVENVIKNGSFDEQDDRLQPVGWKLPPGGAVSVMEGEGNNRYILFKPLGDARRIWREFAIEPQWKTLKISARVRGRGLTAGKGAWENAHVGLVFYNAAGERFGYAWPVHAASDTDWVARSGIVAIPEGAVKAEVDAGNFGPTGEFSVDDLRVEPNGLLEDFVTLRPDFPEGTFEELDEFGAPKGWVFANADARLAEEGGNHFLRLALPKPGFTGADLYVKLEPGTKRVHIQARMRVQNLQLGKEPWENARLGLAFSDAQDNRAGGWPASLEIKADTDWALSGQVVDVPPGAVFLKLTPSFLNASGTFDVDDIQIQVLE